jgi:hypothetical protein
MADLAPGVVGTAPSHVSAAQWQSFEMRMRQRRAARLLVRAQAALEAGLVAEAAAALEEASGLDSSTPDLGTLLARVAPPDVPADVVVVPEPSLEEPAVSGRTRHFAGWLAVGASLALVAALAVWDVEQPAQSPLSAAASIAAPAPVTAPDPPAVATTGLIETPASTDAPKNAASAVDVERNEPAPSAPPAAVPETLPTALPANVVTPEPPPADPVPDGPRTQRADTVLPEPAPAPAIAAPPIAAPASDVTVPAPIVSAPVAPPQPPEPQRTDETPLVRSVLSQYEGAYSTLDVSAAKRVWPSLDTYALARAFGGLQMQRISLGDCRVSLNGPAARADCRGSTCARPTVCGASSMSRCGERNQRPALTRRMRDGVQREGHEETKGRLLFDLWGGCRWYD